MLANWGWVPLLDKPAVAPNAVHDPVFEIGGRLQATVRMDGCNHDLPSANSGFFADAFRLRNLQNISPDVSPARQRGRIFREGQGVEYFDRDAEGLGQPGRRHGCLVVVNHFTAD